MGQFSLLSEQLVSQGSVADIPSSYEFSLVSRQFWPESGPYQNRREQIEAPQFVRGKLPVEPYWQVTVVAEPPSHLQLHQPLLYVENEAGEQVSSDEGTDLQIRLIKDQSDSALYQLRWYNPLLGGEQRHRIVMRAGNDMPALVSDWF